MTSPPARVPRAQKSWCSAPSAVMLRMKWTEPSAKRRFTPPVWLLEKSSSPPSASVVMLTQLLWTRTSAWAGPVALGQVLRWQVGGAEVGLDHGLDGRLSLHRLAEVDLPKQVVLLEVGQQERPPAPAWRCVGVGRRGQVAGREGLVDVVVIVAGEPDLFQVVLA